MPTNRLLSALLWRLKITWHSNALGLQSIAVRARCQGFIAFDFRPFKQFSTGSTHSQIWLCKRERVLQALVVQVLRQLEDVTRMCSQGHCSCTPSLCLNLFLWIEDKPQEFLSWNRYWISIWLLSVWKKVTSGSFHCPHRNCCQSMRIKVPPLVYILLTQHVLQREFHYVMYFSLAGIRLLIKPSNAFEGNTVHLLLCPQTGQKQITENYFFLHTSSI